MNEQADQQDELWLAATTGDCDSILILLRAGCNINAIDEIGETPIHGAISEYQVEAVRVLLEHGADPNAYDEQWGGYTPLDVAVSLKARNRMDERIEIVKMLLQYGADPTIRTWMQVNAIESAAARRNEQETIYQLIINHEQRE